MAEAQAARRFVVLGTISDYPGSSSSRYRREAQLAMAAAEHVLLIGEHAVSVARKLNAAGTQQLLGFATVREASAWLNDFARAGDLVLLKGSNKADHAGAYTAQPWIRTCAAGEIAAAGKNSAIDAGY